MPGTAIGAEPKPVPNGGSARAYEVLRPITLREDRFADLQIPIDYALQIDRSCPDRAAHNCVFCASIHGVRRDTGRRLPAVFAGPPLT